MNTAEIFQLKIILMDTDPPVWRRIQVPSRLTLKKLHGIIQLVMGWRNSHLHQFEVNGKRFSDPSFEINEDAVEDEDLVGDTGRYRLSEIERITDSFIYEYDFGDGWRHEIQIEKRLRKDERIHYPVCIAGERACPPEDCGGVGGYANFIEQLANPKDPEHDSSLTWAGGFFDPSSFDPNHINREHLWQKRW